MSPSLQDSRRLTGANLYWDYPSAVLDVQLAEVDSGIVDLWQQSATQLLAACGMTEQKTCTRLFAGGASLLISAPIDALYSMCELNELAWQQALHLHAGADAPDLPVGIQQLKAQFKAEQRPALIGLQQAAREHGVAFLWDDDEVSIGHGRSCQIWPYDQLPNASGIRWDEFHSIPVALVTGTNGKSTTVRMVAAIMRAAGLQGGLTSTDFIKVGDHLVEEGDYSGTGGARMLLRHPQVETAVLEVARGGLLRRGLAVDQADAALITNVAADHLGEYGINTVAELMQAKFIVHRALGPHSPLILNADDGGIVGYENILRQSRPGLSWWFSLDVDNQQIRKSREKGGASCWIENGHMVSNAALEDASASERIICSIVDITASRNGLLKHNLRNAMGAALTAMALGIPDAAIKQGLQQFRGDESDNPGRGNWFEHQGVHIVVDFAHNEHGLKALAEAVQALGKKRVWLMVGQAGDRTDNAIRDMARAAMAMKPDRLLVYELPGYERGRDIGEPPALIRDEVLKLGLASTNIEMQPNPLAAAKSALQKAQAGDVLVLLALTQRREILQEVRRFICSDTD